MAKKKKAIMTTDEEEDYRDSFSGDIGQLYGCCGMAEITDLSGVDTLGTQIAVIRGAFCDHRVSQILITDTVDKEAETWADTKMRAYKGPITVNPKSNNRIRLYTITKEVLEDLEKAYVEKKEYERKFKGTPAKNRALVRGIK